MREMKDSGIEWIGQIPKDWEIIKLKYTSTLKGRIGWQGLRTDEYCEEGPYLITGTDFWCGKINWNTCVHISEERYNQDHSIQIQEDDLLVSKDGTIGKVAIALNCPEKVSLNSGVFIVRNDRVHKYIDKFMYYTILSNEFLLWYDLTQHGNSTIKHLTQENFYEFSFAYPSYSEQHCIANFLDRECGKIDSLSADIQSEIDILEEYKKSVITEAVTKGLSPDVEMKDSKVEWIGNVPNKWAVSKLDNVLSLRNEKNYKPLEEVNLISLYTDLGVVQHSDLEKTTGNKAQNADGYKIVHKDDIVVNIILAWMGAMGISNYDGVTSPAYDVYKINTQRIVPHFCHYVLRTPALAGECYKYGRGIMLMRWRTYSDEFKKIKMPLPPIDEQEKIANFLDLKCAEIDTIISEKKKQLATLDEYKKSLIYEYVTGKKEVPAE